QRPVAARHVVEGAVGLDVLERDTLHGGDTGERRHLVDDEVFDLLRRAAHLPPAEAAEVRKARMRTHRDARRAGESDRLTHDGRVARMEAAGDVGRGNGRDDGGVLTHAPGAERLANVRVEIDSHYLLDRPFRSELGFRFELRPCLNFNLPLWPTREPSCSGFTSPPGC